MEAGAATEFLALQEAGIPLAGVRDQGDLTNFQRLCLLLEMERRSREVEERAEAPASNGSSAGPTLNSRRKPHGGGRIVERKKFVNKSAETGKDPEELIREHQEND